MTRIICIAIVAIVLGGSLLAPRAQAYTVAQEWQAVQHVTGASIDAQTLLYPATNATGVTALAQAQILHLAPDWYAQIQSIPTALMDAIQRGLQRIDTGPQGLDIAENIIQATNLLDVSSLDAQQEADLIQRMTTGPLASSYLWLYDSALRAQFQTQAAACTLASTTCRWVGEPTMFFSATQTIAVAITFNHAVKGRIHLALVTNSARCDSRKAPCSFDDVESTPTTDAAFVLAEGWSLLPASYAPGRGACTTARTYRVYVNGTLLGHFGLFVSATPGEEKARRGVCAPGT